MLSRPLRTFNHTGKRKKRKPILLVCVIVTRSRLSSPGVLASILSLRNPMISTIWRPTPGITPTRRRAPSTRMMMATVLGPRPRSRSGISSHDVTNWDSKDRLLEWKPPVLNENNENSTQTWWTKWAKWRPWQRKQNVAGSIHMNWISINSEYPDDKLQRRSKEEKLLWKVSYIKAWKCTTRLQRQFLNPRFHLQIMVRPMHEKVKLISKKKSCT